MFCYKCGAKIPEESVFCYKCGVKVVTGEEPPKAEEPPKVEEPPKTQEPSKVQEAPKAQEPPKVEEPQKKEVETVDLLSAMAKSFTDQIKKYIGSRSYNITESNSQIDAKKLNAMIVSWDLLLSKKYVCFSKAYPMTKNGMRIPDSEIDTVIVTVDMRDFGVGEELFCHMQKVNDSYYCMVFTLRFDMPDDISEWPYAIKEIPIFDFEPSSRYVNKKVFWCPKVKKWIPNGYEWSEERHEWHEAGYIWDDVHKVWHSPDTFWDNRTMEWIPNGYKWDSARQEWWSPWSDPWR